MKRSYARDLHRREGQAAFPAICFRGTIAGLCSANPETANPALPDQKRQGNGHEKVDELQLWQGMKGDDRAGGSGLHPGHGTASPSGDFTGELNSSPLKLAGER